MEGMGVARGVARANESRGWSNEGKDGEVARKRSASRSQSPEARRSETRSDRDRSTSSTRYQSWRKRRHARRSRSRHHSRERSLSREARSKVSRHDDRERSRSREHRSRHHDYDSGYVDRDRRSHRHRSSRRDRSRRHRDYSDYSYEHDSDHGKERRRKSGKGSSSDLRHRHLNRSYSHDSRDERDSRSRRRSQQANSPTPESAADSLDKDRRTVFVTQLAARLTNRELREFFEKAGKVHSARIVADRISRRSKGVGYVEFEDLESVPKAVGLTGEKLLGIPIIVQYSEAEKNRQSAVKEYNLSGSAPLLYAPASAAAFADLGGSGGDKLYISNIPAAITEEDIKSLFSTIGEIDSFRLFASAQPPQSTTSRCNDAIVQYKNPAVARRVLTELNGLDLLGTKLAIRHATEQECEAAGLSGQPAVEAVEEQRQQPLPSSPVAPVDAPSATLGNGGERSPVTAPTTAHTISTPTETITSTEQQQQQKQTEEATEESHSASNGTDAGAESPTTALMLSNMFDPEEETAAGEPNWVQELQEDVGNECEKYGHLLRVDIDPNSKGDIYLRYQDMDSSQRAFAALNGRWFGGRQIMAKYLAEGEYNHRVSVLTAAAAPAAVDIEGP